MSKHIKQIDEAISKGLSYCNKTDEAEALKCGKPGPTRSIK